jgi:hypothetical protein
MAEKWRTEKKRPTIKVLPWPAIPPPTTEEVYAGVDPKKAEYSLWIESAVRQQFNPDKPESLDGLRVLDCTTNQIVLVSLLGAGGRGHHDRASGRRPVAENDSVRT